MAREMGNTSIALLSKRKELRHEMKTWTMRDDQLLAYHALVRTRSVHYEYAHWLGKSFELCCLVATDLCGEIGRLWCACPNA